MKISEPKLLLVSIFVSVVLWQLESIFITQGCIITKVHADVPFMVSTQVTELNWSCPSSVTTQILVVEELTQSLAWAA